MQHDTSNVPPLQEDAVREIWEKLRPPEILKNLNLAGNQQISFCPVEEPHARTRCHFMMGDGPVPARGMVVMDGPSGFEESAKQPILNDYLVKMLQDTGVELSEIYHTYATKCAVPKAERERFMEKTYKAYHDTLMEEIRAVKPKAVLLVGNIPMLSVLKMTGITKKRGTEVYNEELDCWFICTVSPFYVQNNPNFQQQFMSDLQKLKRRMDGEAVNEDCEVVWCDTVEKVKQATAELDAMPGNITSLDFETKGFQDYRRNSKIWCVALSKHPRKAYLIPLEHPESPFMKPWSGEEDVPWPELKIAKKDPACQTWLDGKWSDLCRSELIQVYDHLREWLHERKINGHNVKFDARWGRRRGLSFRLGFDTQLSAHLLNENRGLKLLERMVTEYGHTNWGKGKINFDPPSSLREMGIYCAKDTANCHRLYLKDKAELVSNLRLARIFKLIVLPGEEALVEMELNGIWVDFDALDKRMVQAIADRDAVHAQLMDYISPTLAAADGKINFNSTTFLGKWLFSPAPMGLGLVAPKRTKGGKPSVDAEVLESLAGSHPGMDLLLEMRKHEGAISFLEQYREFADEDHRIHPSYNMSGTKTGRRSCTEPNLQQVPRETTLEGIRSVLGAPEGWVLIEPDYSQIELRIAALESRDPVMLEAYRRNRDLHMLTGAMVSGKLTTFREEHGLMGMTVDQAALMILQSDELYALLKPLVTKQERQTAKAVNFGFLYGMGWKKFGEYAKKNYGVTVHPDEAKEFRAVFFVLYAGLTSWHERKRREVRKTLMSVSLVGRERHLPMVLSIDDNISSKAERQGINSPVQGLGGDMALLSEGILHRMILEEYERSGEVTCLLVGDVHDAILFQVRADRVDYWIRIIKNTMENLPLEQFGFKPDIPILTEPKVGARWGKLEEYDFAEAA